MNLNRRDFLAASAGIAVAGVTGINLAATEQKTETQFPFNVFSEVFDAERISDTTIRMPYPDEIGHVDIQIYKIGMSVDWPGKYTDKWYKKAFGHLEEGMERKVRDDAMQTMLAYALGKNVYTHHNTFSKQLKANLAGQCGGKYDLIFGPDFENWDIYQDFYEKQMGGMLGEYDQFGKLKKHTHLLLAVNLDYPDFKIFWPEGKETKTQGYKYKGRTGIHGTRKVGVACYNETANPYKGLCLGGYGIGELKINKRPPAGIARIYEG